MHLLDTNVVSELRKVSTGRADPTFAVWAAAAPLGQSFLSAISLQELETGVLRKERSDPHDGARLRRWLDESVRTVFEGRIVPVDEPVALLAGTFHVPDPAPFRDALIGATAITHGLVLVTRNGSDFQRFPGVRLLNPWR